MCVVYDGTFLHSYTQMFKISLQNRWHTPILGSYMVGLYYYNHAPTYASYVSISQDVYTQKRYDFK